MTLWMVCVFFVHVLSLMRGLVRRIQGRRVMSWRGRRRWIMTLHGKRKALEVVPLRVPAPAFPKILAKW